MTYPSGDDICARCGVRRGNHREDPLNGQAICEDGSVFSDEEEDDDDDN